MRLVRLVYASAFNHDEFDYSELKKIHEQAASKNEKAEITGMLVFGEDQFLQCLEGGREAVNQLYSIISRDKRHSHIVLLSYSEIHQREFENWAMKLVMLTEQKKKLITKYSRKGIFSPFDMSGESCFRLMRALLESGK